MEKPRLEETAPAPFLYCDVDVNPDTVELAGVKSFPTFVYYANGAEVCRRAIADTTKVCQWMKKLSPV